MKKITTALLMTLIFYLDSNGQITKGNWLVGGNFSYSGAKSKGNDAVNSKTRNIDIVSNVGFFLHDKIAAGIKLNTAFSKQKYPQVDGSTNSIVQNKYGIGPFLRYYFLNAENRINIFSDVNANYSVTSNKSNDVRSKEIDYSFFAGAVVFLNTSVGMEFLLGYNNSNAVNADAVGESIQFKIGFQIHLEKE